MRQKYDDISVRSAASFRQEARSALKGKWKTALLVFLVLMLMSGYIIGAECSFESTETSSYRQLYASIGPFSSLSLWKDGRLVTEYYDEGQTYYPIRLPFSPLFVAASALTALFFFILSPIVSIAQIRLGNTLLDGDTPDFSILQVSGRQYWLMVRASLLVFWLSVWPMLLLYLGGLLIPIFLPDLPILTVALIISGFVMTAVRALRYAGCIYLAATQPDMTARAIAKAGAQMMKGRRGRYLCLFLSFTGWLLLLLCFTLAVNALLGQTPLILPGVLLTSLAQVPLFLYLSVTSTAFLRDAQARSNPAPSETELNEQPVSGLPSSEPVSDDPWADK